MKKEKCFIILGTNKDGWYRVIMHTFNAKDAINARKFFQNSALYKEYHISVRTAKISDGPEYGYGPVFDID